MKELAQKMQINLYRHISEGYSDQNQDGYTDAVNDMGRLMIPIELNENQQIVLEHLKNEYLEHDVQYALWQFTDDVYEEPAQCIDLSAHIKAWKDVSDKERFQILAAFAEWGMKEVAE